MSVYGAAKADIKRLMYGLDLRKVRAPKGVRFAAPASGPAYDVARHNMRRRTVLGAAGVTLGGAMGAGAVGYSNRSTEKGNQKYMDRMRSSQMKHGQPVI